MNSVKLTGISIPPSTSSDTITSTFSIKVKYQREQLPTVENPLNGLFDYSQLGRFLESSLSTFDPNSFASNVQVTLLAELARQGIHQGKFKFAYKPGAELNSHARKDDRYHIRGSIEDVAINHGHFQESQKLSETGNSVEHLDWVIKLMCAEETFSTNFDAALNNQEFKDEVADIIKTGLGRGDALELVIDAIKKLTHTKIVLREDVSNKIDFALKRQGVLPSAVVVIGETHVVGQQPEKVQDRIRKYQDFQL